ncbi:MAG TPA: hypothetical protein VGL64_14420 [Amycolatopsis sp.]|jgi:hypothetical protein
MSYTGMAFPQQVQVMNATKPLAQVASQAAQMWQQAGTQLSGASASLQGQLQALEPDWTDQAGAQLQQRGGQSKADIDSWTAGISQTVSQLTNLSSAITSTGQQIDQLVAMLQANPLIAALMMPMLQKQAGGLMDQLAQQFTTATQAVSGAQGNAWSGPLGSSGGGGSAGGASGGSSGGGQSASASSGGGSGASSSSSASGDQASASGGDGAAAGGDGSQQDPAAGGGSQDPGLSGDPSLSGLGGGVAPIAPPALPPLAPLPSVPPPSLPGGLSMPLGGLGGIGGGGGRGFGGTAVPGVRLGGGGLKPLPQAAFPVAQQVTPTTTGQAPAVPEAEPAAPSNGGGGGGGMPMAPMSGLGGAGAGAAGGTPGSGALQRPAPGRGPRRTNPPGLPASLRGKAGRTDPAAFAPLARTVRRDRADDPATVELLDEDLWVVGDKSAPTLEPPAPPRRLAR